VLTTEISSEQKVFSWCRI